MRNTLIVMMALVSITFFAGCGQSSNPATAAIRKLYQPSPDTDVSSSPRYNFGSFAGTVWKTKVKTAVASGKRYTGALDVELLIPKHFDSTREDYVRGVDMQIITMLPAGARVQIERLTQDNGAWGGLMVTATVEDGTNSFKDVQLDGLLLANNEFISRGPTTSTNWDVNPEFLEKP